MTVTEDGGETSTAQWGSRVAALVGRQVAHYRERPPKMSARQLAEATAALGYPITRSNIANLESGRRPGVSVPEVIVLAKALDVPVVALLVPIGAQPTVELLPGVEVSTAGAVAWLSGLDAEAGEPWPAVSEERTGGWEFAEFAHAHNEAVTRLRVAVWRVNRDPQDEAARALAYAEFEVLRRQRDRLPVPPALPPDLTWVDDVDAPDRRRGRPGGAASLGTVVYPSIGGAAPGHTGDRARGESAARQESGLPEGWRPGDAPPWSGNA